MDPELISQDHEAAAGAAGSSALPSPLELKRALPLRERIARFVGDRRRAVAAALRGDDPRLLVIVGPCSIHDPRSAREYAERLCELRTELDSELLVCMRAYCEKPRTALGWKGLVNDPTLDGRCDMAEGLVRARALLLDLCELGMPVATETLDPFVSGYLDDLPSWTAIGARTTESQTHRELASGLSMAVGFKNGTGGELTSALHAMTAARAPHSVLGVGASGRLEVRRTAGNPHAHLVLRGGHDGPNYGEAEVARASERLRAAGHNPRVVVDCSHGNSGKDPRNQIGVVAELARQIAAGSPRVAGVMLESHLREGRQELAPGRALAYGQSITDACLGFDATASSLRELAAARRAAR